MDSGASKSRADGDGHQGLTVGFVARAALVVIGLWALAQMLWLGREILFVAFFAILVALFFSIFIDPLQKVGIPRVASALLVLLVVAGSFVVLFVFTWPILQDQFSLIRREIPGALRDVDSWFRAQYEAITGEVGEPDGELSRLLRERLGREAANIVAGALPLLNTVVGALFGAFIVVFAGLYLAIDAPRYLTGIVKLVPPEGRPRFESALRAVGDDLRRWLLGTAFNMVMIGVLTTIGLIVLDIPAAFALGLIAGVLEFIPIFGPILSAIPAVAIALIISPADAIWVALLYTAIQQLESNVISPLVMQGVVRIPPALTLLVGALMAVLFGFLGLLLAVPILAATMVLVRRLYVERLERGG